MKTGKRSEFLILWLVIAVLLTAYYTYHIFNEIASFTSLTPELREIATNILPMFLPGLIILTLAYVIGVVLIWRWKTWGIGVIVFVSIFMLLFDAFNGVTMFGVFGSPWTQPFINIIVFIIAIRTNFDEFN